MSGDLLGPLIGIGSTVLSLIVFFVMAVFIALATIIPLGIALFMTFKMLKGAMGPQIKDGRSAPAVLLSVAKTGMSINDNPQVRTQIQVHPAEGPPYEATMTFMISEVQVGALQPGNILHVRYDVAQPSRVAMVGAIGPVEAYAPPGTSAAPPLVPMLHRMLASQLFTGSLQKGPEHQGVILTASEVGLYCGGKSPFMAFEIAVEVAGAPVTVKAEGVISQLSVDRYRAGQSVFVRLAPGEPSRAVLVRSA